MSIRFLDDVPTSLIVAVMGHSETCACRPPDGPLARGSHVKLWLAAFDPESPSDQTRPVFSERFWVFLDHTFEDGDTFGGIINNELTHAKTWGLDYGNPFVFYRNEIGEVLSPEQMNARMKEG